MTLAELEAAVSWLERHRLSTTVSIRGRWRGSKPRFARRLATRAPYAATSAYIGVIIVTTFAHAVFQIFGSAGILPQAHDIWPATVVFALILGMATRKYRFGLVGRALSST